MSVPPPQSPTAVPPRMTDFVTTKKWDNEAQKRSWKMFEEEGAIALESPKGNEKGPTYLSPHPPPKTTSSAVPAALATKVLKRKGFGFHSTLKKEEVDPGKKTCEYGRTIEGVLMSPPPHVPPVSPPLPKEHEGGKPPAHTKSPPSSGLLPFLPKASPPPSKEWGGKVALPPGDMWIAGHPSLFQSALDTARKVNGLPPLPDSTGVSFQSLSSSPKPSPQSSTMGAGFLAQGHKKV